MWTRSARNKETGLFTVVCTDWNGVEFFRGEFADAQDANVAGEQAERRMTSAMSAPPLETIFSEMIDDEILDDLLLD